MAARRALGVVAAALVLCGLAGMARGDVILIDNTDPEVTFTGTWPTSTWSSDRIGANYQHSNRVQDLTATYTPDLTAGFWKVEAFWNSSNERGIDVPYTINHLGGPTTVTRDQRSGGGQWQDLGTYRFPAGSSNVVVSSTVSNNEYVVADALRFTTAPDPAWHAELSPVADAFVQGNDSQHGGDQLLQMKSEGSNLDWSRKTYMRFDLSGVAFDHTVELTQAKLRLPFIESGVGTETDNETYLFEVFGLQDGDPGETWDEGTIVWSNAPANDTASHSGMLANAVSLGTFTLVGKGIGPLEFTSAELDQFIEDSLVDDLLTIAIVRHTPQVGPGGVGDNYAHALASKENAGVGGPQLILDGAPIPEPGTVCFLAAGLLGLARRRRKARRTS